MCLPRSTGRRQDASAGRCHPAPRPNPQPRRAGARWWLRAVHRSRFALLVGLGWTTLGCSDAEVPVARPPPVSGPQTITADSSSTCTRLEDGRALCWGANYYAEVGDATKYQAARPRFVKRLETANAVEMAGVHACALVSDGTVQCWGTNQWAGLGNPDLAQSWYPTPVPGIHDAVVLFARNASSCVLHPDRSASCWGPNYEGA